ncbi:MAG TPA: DUF1624 domain-containing protein [Planctomycetes bacterium]|nr:DUF1624 domain-containing protein [Planctomycetota bacterium]HIL38740.1 DUF1624 domain-containing protein [Planctomycetota bacterium]
MNGTAKAPRISGFDLARGLAILGMVLVNYDVVLAYGHKEPALMRTIVDACTGRASALFVTLAGIGIILLGKREVLFKRALFLLIVGYAWQMLWSGDILHYYAFYVAIGALCLSLSPLALGLLAIASTAGFLLLMEYFNYGAGWNWMALEYPPFWTLKGQLRNLFFNGFHPLFPWLAFLFSGMVLGKCQIGLPRIRRMALAGSVLVFVAVHFLSAHFASLEDTRGIMYQMTEWYRAPEALYGLSSMPPGPFYVLSAGASAVFVICLCLEISATEFGQRCATPLIATGQMAFTLYLAHVLVLYFLLAPMLRACREEHDLDQAGVMTVVFSGAMIFNLVAVLGSWLWKQRLGRGPIETLMRRLTG